MKKTNCTYFSLMLLILPFFSFSQVHNYPAVKASVDFSDPIRIWDGFGFNYVEEAQSRDYINNPQDYGGFSLLQENDKQKIVDLIFGDDGLQVSLVKMFLDPFHQTKPGGKFDHKTTTENMRYFVREGIKRNQQRNQSLAIITTLYGPPAYMTKQKTIRGRDLDPAHKEDLANYMVHWVKFLKEEEKFPVKYLSLHNEGEDWRRWPEDGKDKPTLYNHDYNLYWPPNQVVDFLNMLPPKLKKHNLNGIALSCGETFGWERLADWGYAQAIINDSSALNNLGIITAHGFLSWGYGRWNAQHYSRGNDILRSKRPDLHAWVTSTSWSKMDAAFIREIYSNIYNAKVNAIIPWAGIQRPGKWIGGDPNSGCAIWINDNGTWQIRKAYYFYKQVTRAGKPGMAVAMTTAMDAGIKIIAFASNNTKYKHAFILINTHNKNMEVIIDIKGTQARKFSAFRTSGTTMKEENYKTLKKVKIIDNKLNYIAPGNSVTTFFAE